MFWAMDPALFNDEPRQIFDQLSDFLQMLRDSEKAKEHDRIYTHGEKEFCNMEKVKTNGVAMNDATYEEINKLCERIGICARDYLVEI